MTETLPDAAEFCEGLRGHLHLCEEILKAVETESELFRSSQDLDHATLQKTKKSLLVRLNESLDKMRKDRRRWQSLTDAQRGAFPEVPGLLRESQDLIMKIVVLNGENEQALLRRGLVPPRHLPPANRQRPHFVADMYRRNATG